MTKQKAAERLLVVISGVSILCAVLVGREASWAVAGILWALWTWAIW